EIFAGWQVLDVGDEALQHCLYTGVSRRRWRASWLADHLPEQCGRRWCRIGRELLRVRWCCAEPRCRDRPDYDGVLAPIRHVGQLRANERTIFSAAVHYEGVTFTNVMQGPMQIRVVEDEQKTRARQGMVEEV